MNFNEFKESANEDIEVACRIELESDNKESAKNIYQVLFSFYDVKSYSGDVVFTWKSPSLVKRGDYIGSRKSKIENNH